MKKLVFINACIRENESRTLKIASEILKTLDSYYEIQEINLINATLAPITKELYLSRANGSYDTETLKYANMVASADKIIIAAPFWDMSFPSILKVFIERISICGITFKDTQTGTEGICCADKLLLITTRGMNIDDNSPLEQATPYLKAVCSLWGISDVLLTSAYGLDLQDEATKSARIAAAIEKGIGICKEF